VRKREAEQAAATVTFQRLRAIGMVAAVAAGVSLSVAAYHAILGIPEAQEQLNAELQNDVTALYSGMMTCM